MGGGKSSTTTQTVSIPPEVLARYRAVNARAEAVAAQPFKRYEGQFVAGINPTQQAGITGTMNAAGMAQPYFDTAARMTQAGSGAVGPLSARDIARYESPYIRSVVAPMVQALQQQQGQERAVQQAQAIRSGGFGGDRAGLERANLARQQALGMAQAISPIYQQGYQQALQTAMAQQGIKAQDLQRMLAAGQQYAGLGSGAQAAALQAAQAQIGAGTLEQQTQQADLTARYQQFLQERGYPFQVAQFLANIAMGTGALSGSTTTTQQPSSFFSDERVKENIKPIGETFDGQTIYKYNYKGEPATQIGLIAQEVEKKHPEAVGSEHGIKTVDYDRATEHAGGLGKALASMGGAVFEPGEYARGGFAPGGLVDPNDIQAILAQQKAGFGPFSQGGIFGQSTDVTPGAGGIVPTNRLHTPRLVTAGSTPQQRPSGLQEAMKATEQVTDVGQKLGKAYDWVKGSDPKKDAAGNIIEGTGSPSLGERLSEGADKIKEIFGGGTGAKYGGGIRPHYAAGGSGAINPYDAKSDPMDYFPEEVLESGDDEGRKLMTAGSTPGGSGGSGLGNVASAIGAAGTIASGISKIAPMVLAMFGGSDARMKENIEPIGKTYDGQNIYRYNFKGDDATRMGLMAQEVLDHKPEAVAQRRDGMLMLDYDRATEEAVPYHGGIKPREGLQEGGTPPKQDVVDIIRREAEAQNVPFDIALQIAKNESQLNPRAQAKTSSAGGLYGIIDKTYAGLGGEGDKLDPVNNARAGIKYISQNLNALQSAGHEPTAGNVYLSHFLGTEGARRVLANPQAPLSETIPNYAQVVEANPFVARMGTGQDIVGWANQKMSGQPSGQQQKPSGGLFSAPNRFGTDKPQSWGDFLTSKQFVVPFLSGLGAMASSPSRYLGSAILQGIGAGAQSYANLEKQQADIDRARAETGYVGAQEQKVLADIPRTALIVDQTTGRTLGVRVYINGRQTVVSVKDYYDALRSGRPYQLAPEATERGLGAGAGAAGGAGAPAGAGPAAPGGGGVGGVSPEPGAAPGAAPAGAPGTAPAGGVSPPIYRVLPPDLQKVAEQNAITVQETGAATLEKSPEANPFDAQSEAARLSSQNLGQRNMLAKNLAEIGRKQEAGLIQPGKFSAEIGTPVASWLKGFLQNAGVDASDIKSLQDLGKTEVVEKIRRQLSLGLASGAGQRAAQVFEELMAAVPGQVNDPEAAAQLVSDIYFISQREMDLDRYYRNARSIGEQKAGLTQNESRFMGRGLYDEYMKRMQPQYAAEKEAMRRMYLDKIQVKDPRTGQMTQTYVLPYVISNPQGMPNNIRAEIEKRYGKDILRYFSGQ